MRIWQSSVRLLISRSRRLRPLGVRACLVRSQLRVRNLRTRVRIRQWPKGLLACRSGRQRPGLRPTGSRNGRNLKRSVLNAYLDQAGRTIASRRVSKGIWNVLPWQGVVLQRPSCSLIVRVVGRWRLRPRGVRQSWDDDALHHPRTLGGRVLPLDGQVVG